MKDIQLKLTIQTLVILGICVGLSPNARATDIDGVLSNGNNAACVRVLVNLTNGAWNSGFGFQALNRNTTGRRKTAAGINALYYNETRSWTRRVKENITPMGEASETIFALKPVTFWYKKEVDPAREIGRVRACVRQPDQSLSLQPLGSFLKKTQP